MIVVYERLLYSKVNIAATVSDSIILLTLLPLTKPLHLSYPSTYTEKELLSLVATGDQHAFEQLVVRYREKLYAYVLHLTRSEEMTPEIVQDAFVQVWLTREGLHAVEHFDNYLFIICRNQSLNALRKHLTYRRHQRVAAQQSDQGGVVMPAEPGPDILQTMVQRAVEQLPTQQRTAWELNRRSGKKYGEIALEMGLSKETVRKHVQLANAAIVQYLKTYKEHFLWIAWLLHQH